MKRPRDDKGHFVPVACPLPECGNGDLEYQGNGVWQCNGLADPGSSAMPLVECRHTHIDGDPFKR